MPTAAKLVVISAAGVGDSRPHISTINRLLFDHSNIGVAYRDIHQMERVLADSTLDWHAVRPFAPRSIPQAPLCPSPSAP